MLYPAAREITFAEFVKWEQTQPRRHELITGRVVEVANGTFDHETITVNVIVGLDPYVDLPCRIFPATSIIQTISRTAENGFRPDVTVSCSEANVGDGLFVQEPRIVVEVLSPSNMGRDWNAKLFQYVNTPSIEQLVFIDSRTRYTESHIRDANGNWLPEIISEDNTHGEGNLYFPSLGASLLFTQIYRKTALVEAR